MNTIKTALRISQNVVAFASRSEFAWAIADKDCFMVKKVDDACSIPCLVMISFVEGVMECP
jgi:hypothetical protein